MGGSPGFFDVDARLTELSAKDGAAFLRPRDAGEAHEILHRVARVAEMGERFDFGPGGHCHVNRRSTHSSQARSAPGPITPSSRRGS